MIGCRTVLCIFSLDTAIQVTQKMAGFIEHMVYRKPAKGLHTSSVKSVLGRLPLEYNAVQLKLMGIIIFSRSKYLNKIISLK